MQMQVCAPSYKIKVDAAASTTKSEFEDIDDGPEILQKGECGRCGKINPKGKCEIPHPFHLRVDKGAQNPGMQGSKEKFQCLACHEVISTVKCCYMEKKPSIVEGPKFCFRGDHTFHALPKSDKRKVYKGLFNIEEEHGSTNMQPRIEDVLRRKRESRVQILSLKGLNDPESSPPVTLSHTISNLTTLKIVDVNVTKLHLTEELTPNLTDLELRNVPDSCNLKVVLPTLKNISIQFLQPDGSKVINDMLEAAYCLEKFDSYKLWVDELRFASNQLEIIDLHRSDGLEALTIWAPNLQQLGLQACYCLESVRMLKEHPTLSQGLPANHKASTFTINTLFANISKEAMKALKVRGVIKDANRDDCPMACMEECHQRTHKMSRQGMSIEQIMMNMQSEAMANLNLNKSGGSSSSSQGATGGQRAIGGGQSDDSRKAVRVAGSRRKQRGKKAGGDMPPECAQQ